MQKILTSLQEQKNWKQFIKKSCRHNKIGVQIASYFTPNKIRTVYDRLMKLYEAKNQDDSTCWFENQLKAFHWFLAILSELRQKLIENFSQEQWNILAQIFLNKDTSIMQYEAIRLVNQRFHKNRTWSEEETQLLTQIIKQNENSNKWNQVARKLFQRSSHKFFRSGKQCRERWLNHLDPNKKRGQWEQQEDKLIVKYILFNGRRWSNISKQLSNHRTEHMVKNRYKTLIIKQKKLTPRITNENSLIRQIGRRLLGQQALPSKSQPLIRQQMDIESVQLSVVSQKQKQKQKQTGLKQNNNDKPMKQQKQEEQKPEEVKEQELKKSIEITDQKVVLKDPILSQVMEECSKGMGTASTPLSNYELQQIYSPFYINYQGLTPYLSTSPSLPFFMNSSFSAFDNSFNQNLFIKPGPNNSQDKKQESVE